MKKNKAPKELSYTLYTWAVDVGWKCWDDVKSGSTHYLARTLNTSLLETWGIEKPDKINADTEMRLDQNKVGQPVVTIIVNPKLYEKCGSPPNPCINKEPK